MNNSSFSVKSNIEKTHHDSAQFATTTIQTRICETGDLLG